MAAGKTKKVSLARKVRMRAIGARFFRGKTPEEIAHAMELSLDTVRDDLKLLDEQYEDRALAPYVKRQAMSLARYDEIYRAAWEGFESSRGEVTISTMRSDGIEWEEDKKTGERKPVPRNPKSTQTKKRSAGDPRFLDRAESVQGRIDRILGIDSFPTGGAVGGSAGQVIFHLPDNGRDPGMMPPAVPAPDEAPATPPEPEPKK